MVAVCPAGFSDASSLQGRVAANLIDGTCVNLEEWQAPRGLLRSGMEASYAR